MSDLRVWRDGRAGRITLTRPEQLNALTLAMVEATRGALREWASDPAVDLVILGAEGPRAFCAGGDLAAIYHDARENAGRDTRRFWLAEYGLNHDIATFRKPVVTLMQGFVLGGGVGFGCHASHRVVCETTQIGMPECSIGLVPDVGGTHLLARAPGALGAYLGLTGARMGPADAIHTGFADIFVPADDWPDLVAQLVETGRTDALAAAATLPPEGELATAQSWIDRCFEAEDAATILARLASEASTEAARATRAVNRASPLAVQTGLAMIRRARETADLATALRLETRGTARSLLEGDFIEGIRAQIIDKDRTPQWRHASVAEVSKADVEHMLRAFDDPAEEFAGGQS